MGAIGFHTQAFPDFLAERAVAVERAVVADGSSWPMGRHDLTWAAWRLESVRGDSTGRAVYGDFLP